MRRKYLFRLGIAMAISVAMCCSFSFATDAGKDLGTQDGTGFKAEEPVSSSVSDGKDDKASDESIGKDEKGNPANLGVGDEKHDDKTQNNEKKEPENPKLNGLKSVKGDLYFYINDKVFKNGWKRIKGNKYYFGADGKAYKGWKKIKGKKFYFYGSHKMATGVVKVGNNGYFFTDKGIKTKKGFFKWKKNKYFCSGKSGKLYKGFKSIKNVGYYFYKDKARIGKMAKGTKIGYLRIPKSGKLNSAYATGIRILNKKGWTLRKAYNYAAATKYIDFGRRSSSESYANYGFQTRKGNCYVMAAQFYVLAKLLGYDVKHIDGNVVGGWTFAHSWTEVKHGKKWWVYDPNFENLRRGTFPTSGYKIYYGKKDTWRYGRPHVLSR